jgi:hypothetical protein
MTEPQQTPTTPEGQPPAQEPQAPQEPAAGDAKDGLRRQLSEQAKGFEARLAEKEAELAKFRAAQEQAERAKLEEEGKYKELLEAERAKLSEYESKLQAAEQARIKTDLDRALLEAGIKDPDLRAGVALKFSGEQSPSDWVAAYKEANPERFAEVPSFRPAGQGATVETGKVNPSEDLVKRFKAGNMAAARELEAMRQAGTLPDHVQAMLAKKG